MRLKTIKLAGFKSFVDPTSVDFPSNMCAVVGPNGCGKSNIIDAVRWVMGESSAKNLRGEAMTDVIFNGSGSRKPVGQASIELVFDNSDATVTGEYAGYAEISVKRRVTRDGQNLYYLNNNRCRRRDITDIFLGTGLGPRSYAIIEQGMISRLIEAKPEELRVYIEEAAGISKYKERRKDTESRMRRTHENLERLTDIREELERQLARLERQSKAAEKYAEFKSEERTVNAKLQASHYRAMQTSADELKQLVTESELAVEASVTQRVKLDAEIEKYRADFSEKSDIFNAAQGKYYALGTDIARIEQNIKHNQEREQTLRLDIESTERDRVESEQHLSIDKAKIEGWEAELLEMSPESELVSSQLEQAREVLAESEAAMQEWQISWEKFNQRAAEPKQTAEVQQSRIQYLDQVQQRLIQRKEKIDAEARSIEVDDDQDAISESNEQLANLELEIETLGAHMSEGTERIAEGRESLDTLNHRRAQLQTSLQTQKGRLASLEALQAAALGTESSDLNSWALEQNLNIDDRLANRIEVVGGWEKAVETVLGASLQALCSSNPIDSFFDQLDGLDTGVEILSEVGTDSAADDANALSRYVKSDISLAHLLASVKTASSLADAKAKLGALQAHESLITQDGIWVSKNWVRVAVEDDAKAGVIKRKGEIETLLAEIERGENDLASLAAEIESAQVTLTELEQKRDDDRRSYEEKQKHINVARSDIASKRRHIEQLANQKAQAEREMAQIDEQLAAESENLAEARAILEEAIVAIDADSDERETLIEQRDRLRETLDQARKHARDLQDKNHDLQMRQSSTKTQLESMRHGLARLDDQIGRLKERQAQLQEALELASAPSDDQQIELEALLEHRINAEAKLTDARRSMDETETGLRGAEKARDNAEKAVNEQRMTLENTRLQLQRIDVQAQTIKEQLEAQELMVEEVVASLTDEDSVDQCEKMLAELAAKISRLGPINLAAIEEYKTESERKRYLDEQNDDLREALETLEAAIHKIDIETRTRFKETYDKVNSGLQNLFPRLFGGGHAYLELTGEDMLDTGIAIMARPPGKKNSTIHLLSGGEKALTAIALVFSIFQLNPAPFCMLDEVDAPLDDANVGRYANIVHSLSDQVQFIYITHNKIAMEKAEHLMGVTMQEAGVSRMVTVDVEEAAELASV